METDNLYIRYIYEENSDFRLAIIDPPGFGRQIKKKEINFNTNNILMKMKRIIF